MTGTCVRTLDEFVDHLGCSLNDLESTELRRIAAKQGATTPVEGDSFDHVRWSESFLTSVINDSFRLLHMERPDLFVDRVRTKLRPGCSVQELPDECIKFGGELRNSTNCDHKIVPSRMSDTQSSTAERLSGMFCNSNNGAGYEVESYGFNPKAPSHYTIVPAPPKDGEYYVTFNCVGPAPCYNWDEDKDDLVGGSNKVMDIYEVLVIEYALYRAYSSDHESESSKEVAALHWGRALEIVSEGKTGDYFFYHPDLFLMGPIEKGTGKNVFVQPKQ